MNVISPFVDRNPKTFLSAPLKLSEAAMSVSKLVVLSTIVVTFRFGDTTLSFVCKLLHKEKKTYFALKCKYIKKRRVGLSNGGKYIVRNKHTHTHPCF